MNFGMEMPASNEPKRLAVVGSRTFANKSLLADVLAEMAPTTVISGGAKGADSLAEAWARKNGVETLIFLPDHKQYRHAFHHRNRLIAEACDGLVAFWDGHSTGTKYTINYARRLGKSVKVVRF